MGVRGKKTFCCDSSNRSDNNRGPINGVPSDWDGAKMCCCLVVVVVALLIE